MMPMSAIVINPKLKEDSPIKTLAVLLLLVLTFSPLVSAETPIEIINQSAQILEEMTAQEDALAMASLIKDAKGVALFPAVFKAGLVLGGRYGEGLVLKRDDKGRWYGPYFVSIKGVSFGWQIGVQSTALLMVINNDRGMEGFTGDTVTLGGEIGVAAGPIGRQAGAATDAELVAELYSYSMSKGAFAGMSLEGSVIEAAKGANADYWGKELAAPAILAKKASDSRVKHLIAMLNNLSELAQ